MSQMPNSQLALGAQPPQYVPPQPIDPATREGGGWGGIPQSIRSLLEHPFSPQEIRHDVKRHTDGFDPIYVDAPTIIARLNMAFASDWSYEIVSEQLIPPSNPTQVIIRGRLTVGSFRKDPAGGHHWIVIAKEQFGSCFLKGKNGVFVDLGSDFKAAATDALKKCATQFGIALELYTRDEAPMQGLTRTGDIPHQGTFPAMQANPQAPAEQFQIDAIKALFAKLNTPDGVWQQALGLTHPSQVTQGLVQALLSGQHPYVAGLMQQNQMQPGLRATAA